MEKCDIINLFPKNGGSKKCKELQLTNGIKHVQKHVPIILDFLGEKSVSAIINVQRIRIPIGETSVRTVTV